MSGPLQPSLESEVPAKSAADARHVRLALLGLGGVYVLTIAALLAVDQFGVVWKSLVVPLLALCAALLGRFKIFIRDWALFLGAVVLFDAGRGLIYRIVMHFELPVYMGYAIAAEKALFGEPLLTIRIQNWLTPSGQVGIIDKLLAVVYGSHFVGFLFFGLALWLMRPEAFGRWKLALCLAMYAGLVCYLVVPTVPPWMAAHQYFVIDDLHEFGAELFRGNLPSLTATFDINPIAAMPSLHCAFPTLLTLFAFRCFGRFGWAMLLYTTVVFVSTVHLAHHYGVDVLGGIVLGFACYGLANAIHDRHTGANVPAPQTAPNFQSLRVRLLGCAALLVLAHGSGMLEAVFPVGDNPLPSLGFVARELDGKSPMAAYYRGRYALADKRYARAEQLLAKAAKELRNPAAREAALSALLSSAYANHDYRRVVSAANALHQLPAGAALIVAESLIKSGRESAGFRLLDAIASDYRGNAQVEELKAQLESYRR